MRHLHVQALEDGHAGLAGQMAVYVALDGKVAGILDMADELRPDAALTVQGLQSRGIRTMLLSGLPAAELQ